MSRQAKRRQQGEGTIGTYETKAGVRFLIKYQEPQPDGKTVQRLRRGFLTRREAAAVLGDVLADLRAGRYVSPTTMTVGEWLDEWLAGHRGKPSTLAAYRRNCRTHIRPYLGNIPLDKLTGPRITALYRELEERGRVDDRAGEGLSARSVRIVATILKASLAAAVANGKIVRNPADLAQPPTAKEAAPPEIHPWTAANLKMFLGWASEKRSDIAPAWKLLAYTGMRRGEVLALRWRDVDLEAGRLSVRRTVEPVSADIGVKKELIEGPTKSSKPRTVDLDPDTVEVLRSHRVARGTLALPLIRDEALVFATEEGAFLYPDNFTRRFTESLASCRRGSGDDAPPMIRLHDLRHTHATLLLRAGVPVKVVSERLGHASVTITLSIYAHVMPGMQQEAAATFAALVGGASGA